MSDPQALSVSASCPEFGTNDRKVVLKPRHCYVPKVLSIQFRAQVITLSAFPELEDELGVHLLCSVWALRIYVELSSQSRQSEQFFVWLGRRSKGPSVTKQDYPVG